MIEKLPFLIVECRRWVGVTEISPNKGQLVERWQKTVDGISTSESWCMCFVQHHIAWVDKVFHEIDGDTNFTKISKSEHCLTVWNKTPKELRSAVPVPGSIAIWQHEGTTQGHTGIVSSVLPSQRKFLCIEGNTGPGDGVVREGDGVFEKSRTMDGAGKMKLLGFLIPWA
jgi:hypothetical protein